MNIPGALDCPGAELVLPRPRPARSPGDAGRRQLRRPHAQHHRRPVADQRRHAEPGRGAEERHDGLAPRRASTLEHGATRRAARRRAGGSPRRAAARDAVAARFGVRDRRWRRWRVPGRGDRAHALPARRPQPRGIRGRAFAGFAPGAGRAARAGDRRVLATRNARIVLVDDDGVRAAMTASWLLQLGWPEVFVLDAEGRRIGGPGGQERPRSSACAALAETAAATCR